MRFWLFLVVLLLSIGNASAVNLVENGDFGTGDFTGWSHTLTGSVGVTGVWSNTVVDFKNKQYVGPRGASGYTGYVNTYQTIDLTDVNNLTFDLSTDLTVSGYTYPAGSRFDVSVDGTPIYITQTDYSDEPINLNVSNCSGECVVLFRTWAKSDGGGGHMYGTSYIDNIVADDGTPPKINIDTKITQNDEPLTSVLVNDENNTGGFPSEYGYRYLTPYEKDSKEYIVYLRGDDLAPGFEFLVFADSADVSKLTIDIEDLDSTKTYDVFFDYEPLEQISGVSEIQYDITSFSWHSLGLVPVQGVNLYGKVYNATSNATLASANVSLLQGSTHYNTTTDANGAYSVTNLLSNIPIHVNVTKTGYTHEDFNVTPEWTGNFQMDLYMLPVITGVHGLVVDDPWHQGINGSTVWLWNATYNTSTTSNVTGYYLITGIADGVYTMNASKDGYTTSDNINVTVASNTFVQHFTLSQSYDLTVTAVDSKTGTAIQSFTATTETESINTTNGSAVFSLGYGLYYVEVAATGYYPSFGYAFLDENESLEVELTPTSAYYAPHNVKFTVKSLWGTLYSGVDVNVYLGDTVTQYNLHLNETTGTDGAAVFVLTEDVQYTITFIDEAQNIDESRTLYPIHNEYTIIVFGANLIPDDRPSDDISFGCYGKTINMTHGYINVSFNDTSLTTTFAEMWINDTNMTQLYHFNTTDSEKAWSQVVDGGNASYVVTFKLVNTVLAEPLLITRTIHFNDDVRVNLGLDEGWKYQLIAVIIISVIALLGSALNAEIMAVITVLVGWLMVFFGWLQAGATIPEQITLGLMLLFATLLAFGSVIRAGDSR